MPEHITADELAMFISIQLSAAKRGAPILRGKATNRLQAEEHQREFCRWVAERILNAGNFTITKNARDTPAYAGKPPSA